MMFQVVFSPVATLFAVASSGKYSLGARDATIQRVYLIHALLMNYKLTLNTFSVRIEWLSKHFLNFCSLGHLQHSQLARRT